MNKQEQGAIRAANELALDGRFIVQTRSKLRTLTALSCISRQNEMRSWNDCCGSAVEYRSACACVRACVRGQRIVGITTSM